ncbi:hypothetical protein M569_12639, partial [Genlisea aurea]
MPHRTTYFFPREAPGRSFREPGKLVEDHEKKLGFSDVDGQKQREKSELVEKTGGFLHGSSTGDEIHGKRLDDFLNWLSEKKKDKSPLLAQLDSSKLRLPREREDHDVVSRLLHPPDPPSSPPPPQPVGADRWQDYGQTPAKVSVRRLCSDANTSYDESLYSLSTFDQNSSSGTTGLVKDNTAAVPDEKEDHSPSPKEIAENSESKRYAESYCLQILLAKRLTNQSPPAIDPLLHQEGEADMICGSSDAETVSYRLWMSGCLSYADKISDGFYNILGMNPHLWLMSNDLEEGRKMPSLAGLRGISPDDSTMEVTLVDRRGDIRLRELEDKVQDMYLSSGNTLVLAENLGKLVAVSMGGRFPEEQGELNLRWKMVSQRLKNTKKCLVIPIGSLSSALCRHRAILFKKLADSVGLPCRIARGCKYCISDHRSSCLVKIEDERKLSREFVVDLVGMPGNVHSPDSSINGSTEASVPSPLQTSHLRLFQIINLDQACEEVALSRENRKLSSKELTNKPSDMNLAAITPEYLNLEPALATDWLEISWDELNIKERVGAGSFGTVHRAEWHGCDVAVKVLTVQDIHDDQLKEFLGE